MDLADEIKHNVDISIDDQSVELPGDQAATESLKSFIHYLVSENYIEKADLPIESGYKRYLINTEPTHKDGDQMIRPAEIEDGVFVETNYNPEQIKNKIIGLYNFVNPENKV